MTGAINYTEWRQRWPEVIVRTDTAIACDYLQRYYALGDDGRPRYTGARFESMAALNNDPHTLGPADFLAVTMLSVDVPAKAAIRLLGGDAAIITELLHKIPFDVELVDADPSLLSHDSHAGKLWAVLRKERDGLGPTTTSKLLAAKRPRLLPIWDRFVQQATGLDTRDYWAKFQFVLADNERAVWKWLQELRSRCTVIPEQVSELRILDVLLWMSVETSTKNGSGQRK